MKKGLEKFVSILLLVLGVILIVFLALAVFGQLDDATMNNEVVRTMIFGLAFVFLICSVVMIAASFKDNDVLKAVVLSSERASTTRVSLSVIKKIVAKNAKYISGLKVSGVALQLDENNAIRMKLTVKISENDVDFVVDRFRCLLYDAFYATLGVEFASIDFKVKALSPKYAPDMNKVDRAAAEIKEKREKLMLQKLKMEEEEAKYEEERKLEAEKRRREEARLRREREEERKRERLQLEKDRFGNLEDAEEVPVYVIDDDFEMPKQIAKDASENPTATAESSQPTEDAAESAEKEDGLTESKSDASVRTESETIKGETAQPTDSEETKENTADNDGAAEITKNVGAEDAKNVGEITKNVGAEDAKNVGAEDAKNVGEITKNDAEITKNGAEEDAKSVGDSEDESAAVGNILPDSDAETAESLDETAKEAYAETETSERADESGFDGGGNVAEDGADTDAERGKEPQDGSETTESLPENGEDEINKTEE